MNNFGPVLESDMQTHPSSKNGKKYVVAKDAQCSETCPKKIPIFLNIFDQVNFQFHFKFLRLRDYCKPDLETLTSDI